MYTVKLGTKNGIGYGSFGSHPAEPAMSGDARLSAAGTA